MELPASRRAPVPRRPESAPPSCERAAAGVLGHGYPNGQAPALGGIAALDAELGTGVPGLQIDRRCGSGLQAVFYAAGQMATGAVGVVVAGAGSMSNVAHYALGLRSGVRQGGIALMDRPDRARETAGGG